MAMVEHDKFSADLMELEHLLVRQFRALQQLVDTTQKERAAMLENDNSTREGDAVPAKSGDTVMRMVEEKEALLDQLGLIEDSRRRVVEDLAVALKVQSDAGSVGALLPHLKAEDAGRLGRLADGIVTLAAQARAQNHENHALALVRLTWLKAAQSALIGVTQPDVDYRPLVNTSAGRDRAGWGPASLEVRA
jgi:hypothetical protein